MTMKGTLLFFSILVMVSSEKSWWMPFVSPLLNTNPCTDDKDILMWFEAGLQPKDNNWHYIYVNKNFPEDSKVRMTYDSQVNVTFVVRTETNEYSRIFLSEGDTFSLHFFMEHTGLGFIVKATEAGVTPYLQSFTINDVEYCKYPKVGFLDQYMAKIETTDSNTCGRRVMDQSQLIVNGESTKPGDWPWHAALYKSENAAIKYICGGTLISKKFVLTAAHCVTYRGASILSEAISVVLGKYSLTGDDKESVTKDVYDITIHKEFNYRRLVNDIALLKLKTEVVFNEFIRAVCLWRNNNLKKMPTEDINGTIVGWGFDQTDSLAQTLQKATMPIVSEATCLKSNPLFYSHALNDNAFCAGQHNGTSACNGDSGGGFHVFVPDEVQSGNKNTSGTWHVRGVISNTVSRFDAPICDPDYYVIFTNVEKYMDWIDSNLEK